MNGPGERLEMLQGFFYTAIYRLERRGRIKSKWGESENNRRARFYSITKTGTRVSSRSRPPDGLIRRLSMPAILDKKVGEV